MYAQILKENPYHDKKGLFTSKDKAGAGTGIFDNPIYKPIDKRLIDVKTDRPLNDPKKVMNIEDSLPGHQYVVPYSSTPFFDKLNKMQGTPDPMAVPVGSYLAAREKLFSKQKEVKLPIKDLVFTQTIVNKAKIAQNVAEKKDKAAFVVEYKGKYYVMDGHHSIVSRAVRGKDNIQARVLKIKSVKKGELSYAAILKGDPDVC